MKKISKIILAQLKYFFVNPFWFSWQSLLVTVLSLASSAYAWVLYLTKYREMMSVTPVIYASAVLVLNLFLAVIYYPKEKMMSWILIGLALLIQIFMIFFIKMSVFASVF